MEMSPGGEAAAPVAAEKGGGGVAAEAAAPHTGGGEGGGEGGGGEGGGGVGGRVEELAVPRVHSEARLVSVANQTQCCGKLKVNKQTFKLNTKHLTLGTILQYTYCTCFST